MAIPPSAELKLPRELPAASVVTAADMIVGDNGSVVQRVTPPQIVDAAIPLASQSEAEAGTDNTKRMTPLRVSQAISSQAVASTTLAADTGATLVGAIGGLTVQAELDNLKQADIDLQDSVDDAQADATTALNTANAASLAVGGVSGIANDALSAVDALSEDTGAASIGYEGGGSLSDAITWVVPKRASGETDDTLALRRAVALAATLGWAIDLGGREWVVRNTGAASATIIPISSAVFAIRNGTIKVADDCGQYRAIFGPASAYDIEKWSFHSVTFDKNSVNNEIPQADLTAQGRYSITNYTGGPIVGTLEVDGCRFLTSDAVVDVYCPEVSTGPIAPDRPHNRHISVINSTWMDARTGGPDNIGYDQSFINVASDSCLALGNTFLGESWARSPGTALELHSDNCIVADNIVRFFQTGINACIGLRHSAPYSRGVMVVNNLFEVNRIGIHLWPERFTSTPDDNRFAGVGIEASSNQIFHRWTKYPDAYGLPNLKGIAVYVGTRALNVRAVRIANNQLFYDAPDGTDALDRPGAGGGNTPGIGVYAGSKADFIIEGLEVIGNTVEGCPTPGYGFQLGSIKDFRLINNVAVNCGVTQSTTPAASIKSAYLIDTAFLNEPVISGNKGHVPTAEYKPTQFFYLRDRGTTGCAIRMRNNDLDDTGGTVTYLTDFSGMDGRIVIEGGAIPTVTTPISNRPASGSWLSLGDRAQADRRIKVTATTWALEAWRTAAPTSGAWTQNSLVHSNATGSRTVVSWICRTAGSPGTWSPYEFSVTSGTTANRPTLTASDVGVQYIDTTLANTPIWWTGSAWVDATGTSV